MKPTHEGILATVSSAIAITPSTIDTVVHGLITTLTLVWWLRLWWKAIRSKRSRPLPPYVK